MTLPTTLLTFMLAIAADVPTLPNALLDEDAQWNAILACPRVTSIDGPTASGVVIAVKEGKGYLLTAAHAVPRDRVELIFTDRERYPKPAWGTDQGEVIGRWPDPDVALVRFPTGKREVPVLPLAAPGQRPKAFPVETYSVGVSRGPAATVVANTIRGKDFVQREGKAPAFFWRLAATSEPGRSGGPLLDTRGRIIGLAAANRDEQGYFSHLDEIQAALKREGHGWLVPPRQ